MGFDEVFYDDSESLFVCGECNNQGCISFCRPRFGINTLKHVSSTCLDPSWSVVSRVCWLLWRCVLLAFYITGLVGVAIAQTGGFASFATKYTYWTFCQQLVTAIVLLVDSICALGCVSWRQRIAPCASVLLEVAVPHSVTVLILYWALLNCGTQCHWETFFVHAANCGMMLIELIFNRIRFSPMHFVFVIAWDLIYEIYALAYEATSGVTIYPGVTELSNPTKVAILCVALPLMNTLFFAIALVVSYVTYRPCWKHKEEQSSSHVEMDTMGRAM